MYVAVRAPVADDGRLDTHSNDVACTLDNDKLLFSS